jgi:uncharacterized repeat protein (TIGR01451 family)
VGTISNWLLTPVLNLNDGDTVSFWTGSTASTFPDRLEVRMSTNGWADFTITVTNTGDVDLKNVTVSDPLVSSCDNAIGTLAISATVSYGCQDVSVTASYTNVATVTSMLVTGAPGPSAAASTYVNYVSPTSVSFSGFDAESAAISPVWLVALLHRGWFWPGSASQDERLDTHMT